MEESEPTVGQACSTSSESANSLLFLNSLMGSLGQTTCGQGAMSHLVNLSSSTDLVATCRQSISLPHSCGRSKRCGSTIQFDKNAVIRSLFTIFGNMINKDWCPASSQVPQELPTVHPEALKSDEICQYQAVSGICLHHTSFLKLITHYRTWQDAIHEVVVDTMESAFHKPRLHSPAISAKLKWSVEKSWCHFHQVHQHWSDSLPSTLCKDCLSICSEELFKFRI